LGGESDGSIRNLYLLVGVVMWRGIASLLEKLAAKKGTKVYRGQTLIPKEELMWMKTLAGKKFTPLKDAAVRAGRGASEKSLKLFPKEYNPPILKDINIDRSKYLQPHPNISVVREGNEVPVNLILSLMSSGKLGVPKKELIKYLLSIMKSGNWKLFNRGGLSSLIPGGKI